VQGYSNEKSHISEQDLAFLFAAKGFSEGEEGQAAKGKGHCEMDGFAEAR